MTILTSLIKRLQSYQRPRRTLIEAAFEGKLGGIAFWALRDERDDAALQAIPGWPKCQCTACGCDEPATTTDDGGVPVCDECAEYTLDEDGEVHCARCSDVEIVTESCGAGTQTRSYARITPPDMPETDPDGEWACYWETVGDDSHVVSRHTTRVAAETACASHDWPGPSDHTRYLCGYTVRQYIDGEWIVCSR